MSTQAFNFSGPVPSISADGNTNGILWGIDNRPWNKTCLNGVNCQTLYAYDATNLGKMLYNSSQAANTRDVPGIAVKFTTPTIANGKVFIGSQGAVSAYGLLNDASPTATVPSLRPTTGNYTAAQSVTMSDATPNAIIYYTTDGSTPTTNSIKYSTAINVAATTTIKALATASGFANSAVSSATYTISTGTTPPTGSAVGVSLASADTIHGIGINGAAATSGGLDGHGYTYSGTLLGVTVTWAGLTFNLGTAGGENAVSNATIALPAGNYSTLNLLAAAVNGAQANQKFLVTYTDGSTTAITQSLSDWFVPQNFAGESKAVTMAYRLTATGAPDKSTHYLYGYAFAIDATKMVRSVTLPATRNVVVLAMTLSSPAASAGLPISVPLASSATAYATFSDGSAVSNGGIDTHSAALSAALLGNSLSFDGVTYTLLGANVADAATGKTVALPAGKFSTLNLLGTSVNGSQAAQPFVVTYTDGTSTTIARGVSDWASPQSYAGESKALTMAYRLNANGTKNTGTFYLYSYSLALDNTKTVKNVALPANRHVVVLAATLIP